MKSERLTHLIGVVRDREWLTMRELAGHGKFPTAEAARKYVTRHQADLVTGRKGRQLLVDKASFDRFYERSARITA
jgi:hypothetical protein